MRARHAIALGAIGCAVAAGARWRPATSAPTAPVRVAGAGDDSGVDEDEEAGGRHWRVDGSRGPIHVWTPAGFRPETAATVVYAHGYYTDVDEAWRDHDLAEQFRDSGVNALFIAPEVPAKGYHELRWLSLGELVREVRERVGLPRPWGPLLAMGHSGAYRTLVSWMDYRPLEHIILLDGLYGTEAEFRAWLTRPAAPEARLFVVSIDTLGWSEPFARELSATVDVHALDWIPEREADVPEAARAARLLYMRSQYEHMEIVTEGRVIPLLLRLAPLPRLGGG